MPKPRGSAITYRLFSGMKPREKKALLATATEKKEVLVPSGFRMGYKLPVSENESFVPGEADLLIAMRGKELLGSARFYIETRSFGGRLMKVVDLGRLFVVPEHREEGIGTKLFMRLKLLAEEKWKIPLRESNSFALSVMRMNDRVKKRAHGKFAPWRKPR